MILEGNSVLIRILRNDNLLGHPSLLSRRSLGQRPTTRRDIQSSHSHLQTKQQWAGKLQKTCKKRASLFRQIKKPIEPAIY